MRGVRQAIFPRYCQRATGTMRPISPNSPVPSYAMARFKFSMFLSCVVPAVLLPVHSRAGEDLEKKTYAYKTNRDVEIHADVYRPGDTKVRPALVWIHGGALILGSRAGVPKQLLDLCR